MPDIETQGSAARTRLGLTMYAYAGGSLSPREAHDVAKAAGGLVVRRNTGTRLVCQVRDRGWTGPLLADPALYERTDNSQLDTGDGTLFGDRHETWAARQAGLRVAAYLSPSDWVPAGRHDLLEAVLSDGSRFCDALTGTPSYIVLPVHRDWLINDADRLADSAAACGHRVALVLGHKYNPLDSINAIRGLLLFLQRVPGTLWLRSDISGVGALAHGADAMAYGTSSTVRHVWPPDEKNPGGGGPMGIPTVLCGSLLRHMSTEKLENLPDDEGALDCWRSPCNGRSVRRFSHPRDQEDLHAHDLHAVREVAEQVLYGGPGAPPPVWRLLCEDAEKLHKRLSAPGRVDLSPPRYLSAWRRAWPAQAA